MSDLPSVREAAQAVRTQERKLTLLHEARMKAYHTMKEAIELYHIAGDAYDHASKTELAALRYDLEQAVKRAALAALDRADAEAEA